jgi:hypothetical protein
VPWDNQIEVGADALHVIRLVPSSDTTGIRYRPAFGYGLHARWEMFDFLQFSAYFIDAHHGITVPDNGLGTTLGTAGKVNLGALETYSFGARFQPLLHIKERFRAWLSFGVGWGRMDIGRMQVFNPGVDPKTTKCDLSKADAPCFQVDPRSSPYVEFPMGLGVGFDIIPRWLAIEYEFHGVFMSNQDGTALNPVHPVGSNNLQVAVGAFPPFTHSLTNSLALSLHL